MANAARAACRSMANAARAACRTAARACRSVATAVQAACRTMATAVQAACRRRRCWRCPTAACHGYYSCGCRATCSPARSLAGGGGGVHSARWTVWLRRLPHGARGAASVVGWTGGAQRSHSDLLMLSVADRMRSPACVRLGRRRARLHGRRASKGRSDGSVALLRRLRRRRGVVAPSRRRGLKELRRRCWLVVAQRHRWQACRCMCRSPRAHGRG
jgi:hypothetical protein